MTDKLQYVNIKFKVAAKTISVVPVWTAV